MIKILIFFSLILLTACKNNESETKSILRPIYQPFQLGRSKNEAWRYIVSKQLAGNLSRQRKYSYTENETKSGKKYYSKELLIAPESDSMLLGLKIAYCHSEDDLQNGFSNGETVLQMLPEQPPIWDTEIRDDVIDKLTISYGNYDKLDTIRQPDIELHIRYSWLNKNDVDIILDYKATNMYYEHKPLYYYSVSLSYGYTSEMMEKINYRKSEY